MTPVMLLPMPFNIPIVLPTLPIVDSTPGAVIWAVKIIVGNMVTTFSIVSVNTCEKQYTAKSEMPYSRFKRKA